MLIKLGFFSTLKTAKMYTKNMICASRWHLDGGCYFEENGFEISILFTFYNRKESN